MTTPWLKLQSVLAEPFADRPDIQEGNCAHRLILGGTLALDNPRRRGDYADGQRRKVALEKQRAARIAPSGPWRLDKASSCRKQIYADPLCPALLQRYP
jgi:hypothetical protein